MISYIMYHLFPSFELIAERDAEGVDKMHSLAPAEQLHCVFALLLSIKVLLQVYFWLLRYSLMTASCKKDLKHGVLTPLRLYFD